MAYSNIRQAIMIECVQTMTLSVYTYRHTEINAAIEYLEIKGDIQALTIEEVVSIFKNLGLAHLPAPAEY